MIRLHYRLKPENFKQLNAYLALHDPKMKRRLLSIIFSLIVLVIVLSYLVFGLSIYTLFSSLAGIVLSVCFMPRLYWSMVFKRVDHFVDHTELVYRDIEAEIDKEIRIKDGKTQIRIVFEDVLNFAYTRDDCILFYRNGDRTDTLILPVDAFKEDELKAFHLRLEGKVHG